jgi:leucyl-tRNA synthetase
MDYQFKDSERHWQQVWRDQKAYRVDDESKKEKFYCLAQFPYPSGAGLHMGHVAIYTYTDAIARFKKHQGYEVLHPMGWDAFGLPTENHAIKVGRHPSVITAENIANFRRQLDAMGFSYDWEREINTSKPDYFRWTQLIWKKLHQAGLTYKSEMPVNWCDSCKIVVANEEVENNGTHERCHQPTRQRNMSQWMFKITAYAEKLLEGLEELDWPESSKKAQRDWIGKSIGAEVEFEIKNSEKSVVVFTTRPDTLFGATYMVLAPEHALVNEITSSECREAVGAYQVQASRKSAFDRSEMATEKTGVFTGAYAINPLNGEKLPIWIADYVLVSYGTGAIMAVPAHDTRDFEFAKVFHLPIQRVLVERGGDPSLELQEAYTGDGELVNSSFENLNINGLDKKQAIEVVIDYLEKKNRGKKAVNFKLRDWIFARQRYWGEPFPLAYNEKGELILMEDSDLPITLPEVESYQPTETGESPLAAITDWLRVEKNGEVLRRETDTMPQWAGSCWYYLRFMDPHNSCTFASPERQRRWGRVDVYVGGTEHLNLHDLYSRFWHRALYDLGLVTEKEPFQKILHQGMILGPDGAKMSKSAGNVVNPDEMVEKFGADVVRLNLCFMGPVEANKPWNEKGLDALRRYVSRVTRLIAEKEFWVEGDGEGDALVALHKTIEAVSSDMERYRFNTAIARLMELLNAFQKTERRGKAALGKMVVMLSPFAPHFAEEMWHWLGHKDSVLLQPYPCFDPKLLVADEVEIAFQISGKVKGRVNVAAGLDADQQSEAVLAMAEVQAKLAGAKVLKVISVPGRLVNVVTGR